MSNKQDIKDKEPEGEKNKIWVGKDGILHLKVARTFIEEDVMELIKEVKETLGGFQAKAKILADMSTTSIIRSSQFRKRTAEQIMKMAKDPGFEKAAIFGGNAVMRTIASFIIMASGVKNMKIFETREEALKWLK